MREPSRRTRSTSHRCPLRTNPSHRGGSRAVVGAGAVGEVAVDPPGDDPVAAPDGQPVVQDESVLVVDDAGGDEVAAGALVQGADGVGGGGDEDAGAAGAGVGAPRGVGGVGHGLRVAGVDPAVPLIVAGGGGVADAEPGGRGLFPGAAGAVRVDEPAHHGQGRWVGAGGAEQGEGAAGLDRGELAGVTDEQQLRAGVLGLAGERGEGEGAGQAGLVDDQQLTVAEPPPVPLGPRLGEMGVEAGGVASPRGRPVPELGQAGGSVARGSAAGVVGRAIGRCCRW